MAKPTRFLLVVTNIVNILTYLVQGKKETVHVNCYRPILRPLRRSKIITYQVVTDLLYNKGMIYLCTYISQ